MSGQVEKHSQISPSTMERVLGQRGSTRRYLGWLVCAFILSTAIRDTCFRPNVLGAYLVRNFAPVEKETVAWWPIMATRLFDLVLGSYLWCFLEGSARREGVLFGLLVALLSRSPLYAFEHAYFLISDKTSAMLLLIDAVSIAAGFALLPTFLPHSVEARPPASLGSRLAANRELVINIILAYTVGTTTGAFMTFFTERKGGLAFFRSQVSNLAHPTLEVPTMRMFLGPNPMLIHLGHCFATALLSIPLVIILPRLGALQLAILVTAMIAVPSVTLLWDVLPITLKGALGVGTALGLRAGVTTGIVAWILEELRVKRFAFVERERTIAVDEQGDVVAVIDKEVVVEEEEREVEVTSDGIRKRHPRA